MCIHSHTDTHTRIPTHAKYIQRAIQTQSHNRTHTGQNKEREQRNRGVGKAGVTCQQGKAAHTLCLPEMRERGLQLNMAN